VIHKKRLKDKSIRLGEDVILAHLKLE